MERFVKRVRRRFTYDLNVILSNIFAKNVDICCKICYN